MPGKDILRSLNFYDKFPGIALVSQRTKHIYSFLNILPYFSPDDSITIQMSEVLEHINCTLNSETLS